MTRKDFNHWCRRTIGMMVARDGVEPPTPAFSALCCVLNNLSDFRAA